VSGIPRKHAHLLQRLYSLAFGCETFAYAKDQASFNFMTFQRFNCDSLLHMRHKNRLKKRGTPMTICTKSSAPTKYLLRPMDWLRLRKSMEEDNWKAVLGKTERTVWW